MHLFPTIYPDEQQNIINSTYPENRIQIIGLAEMSGCGVFEMIGTVCGTVIDGDN